MIKIENVIYCESTGVNTFPDGSSKTVVNQPLISMPLEFIPSLFSFSIVVCLSNVTESIVFRLLFKNRAKNTVIFDSGNIPLELPRDAPFVGEALANLVAMNVKLEDIGEYFSEIYVNSDLFGEYPITVRKVESNVNNAAK